MKNRDTNQNQLQLFGVQVLKPEPPKTKLSRPPATSTQPLAQQLELPFKK